MQANPDLALISAAAGIIISLIAAAVPAYNDLSGEKKAVIMVVLSLALAVGLDLYEGTGLDLRGVFEYLLAFQAANQTTGMLASPFVKTAKLKRLAARNL
jgi:hypothetical protein